MTGPCPIDLVFSKILRLQSALEAVEPGSGVMKENWFRRLIDLARRGKGL